MMQVPLLDLKREYAVTKADVDAAVHTVLDHAKFILGPEVKQFEEKIAAFTGADHAVGVASGSDALVLALRAGGVGAGDEVITSTFSFFASAGSITRLGARPVFVDIDPQTYNIDPEKVTAVITDKTKAIMPVYLFGQTAEMDPIIKVARAKGIKTVGDAAQALSAEYKGKKAGALCDLECFSFFPSKNLGCAGDGGMVTATDPELADQLRILRVHGSKPKYYHKIAGYNSRLATIQAAILLAKFPHLDQWSEARAKHAAIYDRELAGVGDLELPFRMPDCRHIYNQYTIATDQRNALMERLQEKQIGHAIYYPIPLHMQECYADLGYKAGDFPHSEKRAAQVVSIPVFPYLTEDEQAFVIETIKGFFE
jgi:dTDP-4-amino-4,6-dideoxygalactose transaminase